MTDAAAEPGIGHNRAPTLAEELADSLPQDLADELKRTADLLAGCERLPEAIDDEVTAGKFSDFIGQLEGHVRLLEKRRKEQKEPYLRAGDYVDDWFRAEKDRLTKSAAPIQARLGAYQEAQEEKRRAEQKRLADEAAAREQAALDAAKAAMAEGDIDKAESAIDAAVEHRAEAQTHAHLAGAKPNELTRVRGAGSLSWLQETWTFEITSQKHIPLVTLRPYLALDAIEAAIRRFMKANEADIKSGKATLKGVRFFAERKPRTRA